MVPILKSDYESKDVSEQNSEEREKMRQTAIESEQLLLDNIVKFRSSMEDVIGKVERYLLPRPAWCVSNEFIKLMNRFATKGGFH